MNLIGRAITIAWIITNYGTLSLECEALQKREKWKLENSSSDCYRSCEFPAKPRLCSYEFTVTWTYTLATQCTNCPNNYVDCEALKCVVADGSVRPVITTNDIFPGPKIEVCHGDIIRVKVNNNLFEDGAGLTIHWHGIHQFETVWADGVPMITQCPIPNSSSFVYKFVADPPGTHWWHSHVGVQRGDGMYGIIIVRVPRQTEVNSNEYDFDLPNHYLLLGDWLSISSLEGFLRVYQNGIEKPHFYSILVNGKGRNKMLTQKTPLEIYEVEQGYRYRMRVVNTMFNTCDMQLTIAYHPVTVIATDGYEIHPITTDSLIISPGERLDFVLETSQAPSVYCIHVIPIEYATCPVQNGTAILRYNNAPETGDVSCTSPPPSAYRRAFSTSGTNGIIDARWTELYTFEDTYSYVPVDPDLHTFDVRHYINIESSKTKFYSNDSCNSEEDYFNCRMLINHVEFKFPQSPLVFTGSSRGMNVCQTTANLTTNECKNRNYCNCTYTSKDSEFVPEEDDSLCIVDNHCKCTNVLKLQIGQVVDLLVSDSTQFGTHPMHLHGQSFHVLAQGIIPMNMSPEELIKYDNEVGLPRLPLNSSVIKDTIVLPENGYVILRWKPQNPGYWLFHCHVDFHILMGMAMIFQVGEDDEMPDLPKNFPTCGPWSPD